MKKKFKAVSITIAALFFLFYPLLHFFLNSDFFRQQTTKIISAQLPGRVEIGSIVIAFDGGLQIQDVNWFFADQKQLSLNTLEINLDFGDLLKGKLTIDKLRLSGSKIDLHQAQLDKFQQQPTAEPSTPIILPLAFDLKQLQLENFQIAFTQYSGQKFVLHNCNLNSRIKITSSGLDLAAAVNVERLQYSEKNRAINTPLAVQTHLTSDLLLEQIKLEDSQLKLGDMLQMQGSLQLSQAMHKPKIVLQIAKSQITVAPLLSLLKPWLPAEYQHASITGTVNPTLTLAGSYLPTGFSGVGNIDLAAVDLVGKLPTQQAFGQLKELFLKVNDLTIKENRPQSLQAEIKLGNANAGFGTKTIHALEGTITADLLADGNINSNISLHAKTVTPDLADLPGFTTPVTVAVSSTGNLFIKEAIKIDRFNLQLPGLLEISGHGASHIDPETNRQRSLVADIQGKIYHTQILKTLPAHLLADLKFTPTREQEPLTISASLNSMLGNDMYPLNFTSQGSIKMGGLLLEQQNPPHLLEFASLDIDWQGAKPIANTDEYQEKMVVDIQKLRVADEFNGLILPKLSLTMAGKHHMDRGDFFLNQLQMIAGDLFSFHGNGQYIQKKNHFAAAINLDNLDLAKLGNRIRVTGDYPLLQAKAKGIIGLTVEAAGNLDNINSWDQQSLPLQAKLHLDSKKLSGVWQKNILLGADVNLDIKLTPKQDDKITIKSSMAAKEISLAKPGPWSQLHHPQFKLLAHSQRLDQIKITQLKASVPGADATAKGTISGLKPLLNNNFDGSQLMAMVMPIFLDLQTKLQLDIGKQQSRLKQQLAGSGQSSLRIDLFKKEQGKIRLQMVGEMAGISLKKKNFQLHNANGKISLTKTLFPATGKSLTKKAPQPHNNLLGTPLSILGRKKGIFIDSLQLAGVRLQNIAAQITFLDDQLKLQNFSLDLLQGTMAGDANILGGKAPEISINAEGVALNLNRLLPTASQISGDSSINFVSRNTFVLMPADGRLDWGKSNIQLIFSKIGPQAVDRLLLALDPKESNPAIIDARNKVGLANPARLHFQLAKGVVKLQIDFSNGLLSSLKIERIPMAVLGSFAPFKEFMEPLSQLTDIFALMGARQFDLDNHENPLMQ